MRELEIIYSKYQSFVDNHKCNPNTVFMSEEVYKKLKSNGGSHVKFNDNRTQPDKVLGLEIQVLREELGFLEVVLK